MKKYSLDEINSDVQLLEKIKRVDGAGSGLDADLVRGLPADFTSSLSENGYQILPSGLIIQWVTSTTDGDGKFTATFPIAFPNEGLAGFSTVRGDNYTAQNGKPSTTKISGTTLNIDKNGSSGKTVNSLAIGY